MLTYIAKCYQEFYDYGGIQLYKLEPFVKDWPLTRDPIPPILITLSYLLMVYLGPIIMKPFKPFELRRFLMIYNLFLCIKAVRAYDGYLQLHYRKRLVIESGPGLEMVMIHYLYMISKIIEFVDTYLPAAEICVSLVGRFGYFAFPTPQLPVVNALWGIRPAVFKRANLSNPYSSSILGYSVHATRDLARSRIAIIAWPTGLSGDSQVRNMPTAVSSTRGYHLTAGQAGTTQDRR
ncbi:hypothetical protein RF11_02625 [Thelohanellus kitauei]|uniref:Elongation of very long chain fatty acids protein n=1 Tax=Thelohanellus kitauei TaxID=669202 RepID=A0A0C2MRB9_THEKT|nr:hypothetical protein RF11_02625 [Thelohanellus kitauei]